MKNRRHLEIAITAFTLLLPIPALTQGLDKMIKGKKVAWYETKWRAKADEILKDILEAIGLPVVR